ncbi:hypothetical protein RHGRI_034794 [Rhododendron griersonianum]|nr:hypothetical protein RHGRI_034794 [Rhododendron griersonianum]
MMDGENKFRWTVKHIVDLKPLALPRRSTYVMSVRNVGANENDLAVVLCIEGLVIQYTNIKCQTLKVLCDLAGGDFPTRILDSYHFIESLTPV